MGRELRRVPENWDHPKRSVPNHRLGVMEEQYQPMRDQTAQEAFDEWLSEYQKWLGGEHDKIIAEYGADDYPKTEPYRAFCEWHGSPPTPEYYRPAWKPEELTWWQVWETVSEGTPVTPPFATQAELIEYLVANGDFWDQSRRAEGESVMPCEPWTRQQAESFVLGSGWAPSMVAMDGKLMSGVEAMAAISVK